MDRRDFLKTAAFAAAGAMLAKGTPMLRAGEQPPPDVSAIRNARPGMRYRPMGRTGVMVSALGFGLMRPPMLADGVVDVDGFQRMVRHAIDSGLNYVDTSHVYSGGKSQEITARILGDGYREKVHLATKMPWWQVENPDDFERILDGQLETLRTGSIDFYLMHAVTRQGWDGPIGEFELIEKMEKAKEQGKIRHMGFSFHADLPLFKKVVDRTPNWDFCQIQLNYLDTEYEAGILGMKYASDRGLGVVAMEPLRGGFLANPPAGAMAILDEAAAKRGAVEWAFDYLWNMPEVSVVLSGMSAMEHVVDNLDYASRASVGMLNGDERNLLSRAILHMNKDYGTIPCTGCEYCHPVCPEKVAIAQIIIPWNQYKMNGDLDACRRRFTFLHNSTYGSNSNACTDCGKCALRCPQGIDVPGAMLMIRDAMKT